MSKKFEYINSEMNTGFPCIEVRDVIGLVHLAEAHPVKFIFKMGAKEKDSAPEEFFFPLQNVIYKIKANRFLTLEDFYAAVQKNFPSAEDFYEAQKNGYDSYEEFRHSKSTGIASKETFDLAKSAGFVRNFELFLKKYESYKQNPHTSSIDPAIDSAVKLYEYAREKGFKSYTDFEKAHDAHYPDMPLYTESTSKEFKTADDFFDAVRKGFSTPYEHEDARELMITTKKEYDDYRHLKLGNIQNLAFDEWNLLTLLREFDNGKKFTLAELRQLLLTEQEKYKRSFTESEMKVLPVWYIQKISTNEQMHNFLSNEPGIKKLGTYNAKEKTFEIFHLSKTKVYVDASNVAHNSGGNVKSVPLFKNIRLVVEELGVWKFTDIVVIADASLRHKAKDTNELEKIKKLAEYHETPSHTSADKFLLELIHRDKCIIVSNDTFSDWKKNDYWVRVNIDNIRIPFMIKDDRIIFSGIEKYTKENENQ